ARGAPRRPRRGRAGGARLTGATRERTTHARTHDARGGPMTTKKALISGITGQDGSYLAELLLLKGYEVHGLIRRASTFNTARVALLSRAPHAQDARLFLPYAALSDGARLVTLISQIRPDEVYNLAAQSHVRVSFDEPEHTADTTGTGAIRLLEAVRL